MAIREIYFDDMNSGCVPPEVVEVMIPYMNERGYGHPGIPHKPGYEAVEAIEWARSYIAETIGANPDEITFTSGATESNNLAIIGYAFANQQKGKHIIISSIEHQSVLYSAIFLKKFGFQVDYLPVDEEGFIDLDILESIVDKDTILVSIMLSNSEIGTIEPIKEAVKIVKDINKNVAFHTDASDAYTRVKFKVDDLGVDMLTLSSHMINGPKGAGALYIRKGIKIEPILHGAIATQPLRHGAENVPAIVGFAKAAELAFKEFNHHVSHMRSLRDMLIDGILDNIEHTLLNGPRGDKRTPHNVNVSFLYVEGEAVMIDLSLNGIYVSTGSACSMRELEPSHVLLAIGRKHEEAHGSIQFTINRYHTKEDIEYTLETLPKTIERLRNISAWKPEREIMKPGEVYRGRERK